MKRSRPAIFRGRHFEPEIIATCVRWYLRFSLSLRNVEEMMAERGLMVDPTRPSGVGCQKYGPIIYQRATRKAEIHDHHLAYGRDLRSDCRPVGCICSVPWIATATRWTSICRKREIVRRPKRFCRKPYRIRTTELHTCCAWTSAEYTPQRFEICKPKGVSRSGVGEGPNDTPTIELNRTTEMSNGDSVPCRARGRCRRRIA
jgi:hypothetical protein